MRQGEGEREEAMGRESEGGRGMYALQNPVKKASQCWCPISIIRDTDVRLQAGGPSWDLIV